MNFISLLFQVGMSGGFGQDIKHCHLVDFLHFDDKNHDNSINWNEFLAAFHNFVPTGMQKKIVGPSSSFYRLIFSHF